MTPDINSINQKFSRYSLKAILISLSFGIVLLIVCFGVSFWNSTNDYLHLQRRIILTNTNFFNYRLSNYERYLELLSYSYQTLPNLIPLPREAQNSYIDKNHRYIYSKKEFGTLISLEKPIETIKDADKLVIAANQIIGISEKRFNATKKSKAKNLHGVLWTYFYSPQHYVYLYPYLTDPNNYNFSLNSFKGDIYTTTSTHNKLYYAPFYIDVATKQPVFSIAKPMFDQQKFLGTWAVDVDLTQLAADFTNLNAEFNGEVVLMDKTGQVFNLTKYTGLSKISIEKLQQIKVKTQWFSLPEMRFYFASDLYEIKLVCYFDFAQIFFKTLKSSQFIIDALVILFTMLLIIVIFYKYVRPQYILLLDILNYLSNDKTYSHKVKPIGIFAELRNLFYHLINEFKQKIKLDKDIESGQSVIKHMTPNMSHTLNYAYLILPAFNFSGDYIRVFKLQDNNEVFFVADIAGKGISAMAILSKMHTYFDIKQEELTNITSFEQMLHNFNRYFMQQNKNCDFIAFSALGQIQNNSQHLYLIQAGLPTPYYLGTDQKTHELSLPVSYTPLGIFEEEYTFTPVDASNIQKIFMFSDGVLEQTNAHEIEYKEHFIAALQRNSFTTPHNLTQLLADDFCLFRGDAPQHDDFSLLTVNINSRA